MGKYAEALGIWELRVGGFNKDLRPKKGDNLKLARIIADNQKKDFYGMAVGILGLVRELISREYPPESDEERLELDEYLEFNMIELVKETLIAFRWTKRESFDNIDGEQESDKLKKFLL